MLEPASVGDERYGRGRRWLDARNSSWRVLAVVFLLLLLLLLTPNDQREVVKPSCGQPTIMTE